MSASVRWAGLEELREQLRNMPADLTAEASHIVEGAANGAEADILLGYPDRTGDLRSHVTKTRFEKSKFTTGIILKNTAKHAWIFENGTQARHTAIGANRGAMPPGHVFVPAVQRARRRMFQQLRDMLVRAGLTVRDV